MTAHDVPDEAVEIATDVWEANTHDPDLPRDVVAALAAAGWLHDPAEVAALRAVADAARHLTGSFIDDKYMTPSTPSALREARRALDSARRGAK